MTDNKLRQAAQQALETLEQLDGIDTETECVTIDVGGEITALRAALAEQPAEQEPVAPTIEELEQEIYENTRQFVSQVVMQWMIKRYYTAPQPTKPAEQTPVAWLFSDMTWTPITAMGRDHFGKPVYDKPAKREPLTDDEIAEIVDRHTTDDHGYDIWCDGKGVARAVERAHGIGEQE